MRMPVAASLSTVGRGAGGAFLSLAEDVAAGCDAGVGVEGRGGTVAAGEALCGWGDDEAELVVEGAGEVCGVLSFLGVTGCVGFAAGVCV
ncbi:hypothetical protein [Kozakia baliensis]|uniref:hypothetical protein n=1 Tax=Kozakia baliensis TaxID=153496 RepID=UPI00056BC9C2|nr:hypothetical protein [Kozakia baliensis]